MPKRLNLALFLLSLLVALNILALSFFSRELGKFLFAQGAYYFLALLFALWLFGLTRWFRDKLDERPIRWRECAAPALVSLLLSVILFVSVGPRFRLLSDETNLLGISKSMLEQGRMDRVTMGMWIRGHYEPLAYDSEKRPGLYPFFIHLVHGLAGYRPGNSFVVNFIALFFLFLMAFDFLKKKLGDPFWAYSGLVLMAAQPLFSLIATSGGMDFLSLFFLFLCFWICDDFLQRPSALSFEWLWINLLMLAVSRYESAVVFLLVLSFLWIWKQIRFEWLARSLPVALSPVLLLPVFWQRLLHWGNYQNPSGVPAWSWKHFLSNHEIIFRAFSDFRDSLPFADTINVLGLASAAFLLIQLARRKIVMRQNDFRLAVLVSVILLTLWMIVTSYYSGQMDHPFSGRFYGVFVTVLSLLLVLACSRLASLGVKPGRVLLVSVGIFFFYHPVAMSNEFTYRMRSIRQFEWVLAFLREQGDSNFLLVIRRPHLYPGHGVGVMDFDYANEHAAKISGELAAGALKKMFVVQEVDVKTAQPVKGDRLGPPYRLRKIEEWRSSGARSIRISEVFSRGGKSQ